MYTFSRHGVRQFLLAKVTGYVVVTSLCGTQTHTSEATLHKLVVCIGIIAAPNTNVQNETNNQIKLLCNYHIAIIKRL